MTYDMHISHDTPNSSLSVKLLEDLVTWNSNFGR
jgi:hypothetical protein